MVVAGCPPSLACTLVSVSRRHCEEPYKIWICSPPASPPPLARPPPEPFPSASARSVSPLHRQLLCPRHRLLHSCAQPTHHGRERTEMARKRERPQGCTCGLAPRGLTNNSKWRGDSAWRTRSSSPLRCMRPRPACRGVEELSLRPSWPLRLGCAGRLGRLRRRHCHTSGWAPDRRGAGRRGGRRGQGRRRSLATAIWRKREKLHLVYLGF
jgi:hypothetical protein